MKLLFYNSKENIPNNASYDPDNITIYLAGPTDRTTNHTAWRKEFLTLAKARDTDNLLDNVTFIIPEFFTSDINAYPIVPDLSNFDKVDMNNIYDTFPKSHIYRWELNNMENCTKILFWVDRNIKEKRYALTTNVEFGKFYKSQKCYFGGPRNADKNEYLEYLVKFDAMRNWYYSFDDILKCIFHDITFIRKTNDINRKLAEQRKEQVQKEKSRKGRQNQGPPF